MSENQTQLSSGEWVTATPLSASWWVRLGSIFRTKKVINKEEK